MNTFTTFQRGRTFAKKRRTSRKIKFATGALYALIFISSVILGFVALYNPAFLLNTNFLAPILGVGLFAICLMPTGGIQLGDKSAPIPFVRYLSKVMLAQFIFGLLSLGFFVAVMTYVPVRFYAMMTFESTFEVFSSFYDHQFGFFPWVFFVFWGVALAYNTYVEKRPPFITSALHLIFKQFLTAKSKIYCEIVGVWAVAGCLGAVLGAGLILVFNFIRQNLNLFDLYIMPFGALAMLFFITPILYFTLRPRFLFKRYKKLSLAKLLIIIMSATLILLLISCIITNKLFASLLEGKIVSACSSVLAFILQEGRIESAFWGWGLIWLPLAGSFIAYISKGRTIREVVLAVFLLPIVIKLLIFFNPDFSLSYLVEFLTEMQQSILLLGLGLLCIGFGLWLTKGKTNNSILYAGFMPLSEKLERSRNSLLGAPRFLGISKFAPQVVLAPFVVVEMHLLGGWSIIILQYVVMGVFLIPIISCLAIALILQLFLHGPLFKNGTRLRVVRR